MNVEFVNEPLLSPVGVRDEWVLREDFHVRIDSGDAADAPLALVVPKGFSTDLASVPRLPGAYVLFGGKARRSAILHDYLYELRYPRAWADDVFRAAMAHEVGPVARYVMWLGVRLGGGTYYADRVPSYQPPVPKEMP